MKRAFITACGCVNEAGFGGARRWTAWPPGPRRLRWRTLSRRPFDRFGRLDLLCKYAVAAVEMLGLPPPEEGETRSDVALYLGSEHGSLDVDVKFYQSIGAPGGASPTLFSYTLPSMALGEISIRHAITGPNLCLSAGPESGLLALWEGAKLVAGGEVRRCICIGCDAVSPPVASAPVAHGYAFLVGTEWTARGPVAELRFTRAARAKARALRGDELHGALGWIFRLLASSDGKDESAALYLHAPTTLNVSEVLVVRRGSPG